MPQMFDDVGEIVEEALRRVGRKRGAGVAARHRQAQSHRQRILPARARRSRHRPHDLHRAVAAQTRRRERPGESVSSSHWRRAYSATTPSWNTWKPCAATPCRPTRASSSSSSSRVRCSTRLTRRSHYLSANYTHVARELLHRGVNVIAHVVARRVMAGVTEISLGSNPDVTVDLLPGHRANARGRSPGGDARPGASRDALHAGRGQCRRDTFDLLLDHSRYDYDLFAPPNPALATVDHAIGLHASSLVRDAGTLQIGIGELGDSIVYSLLLRHQQNAAWRRTLSRSQHRAQCAAGRRHRRPRAVHHRPVRRHRDVRRPDAGPVPRRNSAPACL